MVEERVQRRLAVILAADVVGYSRLMGEDEEATLATLKSYRSVIDELIRTHDGRVFGSAGDSVIAEFASPVEAVRTHAHHGLFASHGRGRGSHPRYPQILSQCYR